MTTNSRREFLGTVGTGALAGALGSSLSWTMPIHAAPKADRPKIKIGQIGVGHAHANKLSVYRASDDYEVVGIVEPDAKLRKQAEA